jgi:integrase/recombinase XerD
MGSIPNGIQLGSKCWLYQGLAQQTSWFANIDNPRTRRAYQIDLTDFMHFVGILNPSDFRMVTRAHLIAWRKDLEQRQLGGATIRRKLAALSSLFEQTAS